MFNCSRVTRIRISIAAIVGLYALGLFVLGTVFMVFDTKVKIAEIPKSMIEHRMDYKTDNILPIFLVVIAGVGLPLGAYTVATLAACEKEANKEVV